MEHRLVIEDRTGLPSPPLRVLVVDDNRMARHILRAPLERWGYQVAEAPSAEAALALCGGSVFDIVLSDWMMPGLSGPEFCRAFRALPGRSYGYFILCTAKSGKEDLAQGLDSGADDFLSKPVDPAELRARIQAGARLLAVHRELDDKNRLLRATIDELQGVYDALDRDIAEARKLQLGLVRDRSRDFGTASVALMLRPSGHIGGDLVGYFPLGRDRLAFYAIDVAGHGVASAVMAARLAGMLAGASPEGNVALDIADEGLPALPPEMVAARLNRIVIDVMQVEQYFTCIFGEADMRSGRVRLVQAGHPHPLVLRADGRVEPVGEGGLPVGLVPGARHEAVEVALNPGDRLFMMSDGLTECMGPGGIELGQDGLSRLVEDNRALGGGAFLDALMWDLERHAGGGEFADDVSAILYEFHGPLTRTG